MGKHKNNSTQGKKASETRGQNLSERARLERKTYLVVRASDVGDIHVSGSTGDLLVLLVGEDVNTGDVGLGSSVLAGLGGGHVDDLARVTLKADKAVLAKSGALSGSNVRGVVRHIQEDARSDLSETRGTGTESVALSAWVRPLFSSRNPLISKFLYKNILLQNECSADNVGLSERYLTENSIKTDLKRIFYVAVCWFTRS